MNEDGFKIVSDNKDIWYLLIIFLGDYIIVRIVKDVLFKDRFMNYRFYKFIS